MDKHLNYFILGNLSYIYGDGYGVSVYDFKTIKLEPVYWLERIAEFFGYTEG